MLCEREKSSSQVHSESVELGIHKICQSWWLLAIPLIMWNQFVSIAFYFCPCNLIKLVIGCDKYGSTFALTFPPNDEYCVTII